MYGILFTMHTGHVASMEHIEGIPSKEIAESVKKEWFSKNDKYKEYASAVIYEMEKSEPAKEQPLFCYSTGPSGAVLNLTQEQLDNKLTILCSHLRSLKSLITNDATSPPYQIELASVTYQLAIELSEALPNEEPEDPNA